MTRRQLAALMPGALALVAAETQPGEEPLRQGLSLLGLEFKPEQLEMMRPGVERQLATYAKLRAVEISPDVDPAFTFSPVLPGVTLRAGKGQFLPSRPRQQAGWKNVEELAFRPVTELAELLRARKVSSLELTRMYLERLKRHSPALLCTITLTEDLALEQARRADAELNRGRYRGPLHGIPYGAKDLFAVKGYKTTWGAEPYRDQVIDANATVIERLDAAGAVLCAKLSMGALAMGGLWFGGMTKTPWNLEQSSSGSSAGSASATAAGLVAFSLGTETLGSIVSPSARCGVTGLRPTFGRVPRTGAMALSWTMDKIGPICRSAEDCMLVLRAMDGPDGMDLSARYNVSLAWNAKEKVKGMRVGVLREDFERSKRHNEALAELAKTGVELIDTKLPEFPASELIVMLNAESAAAFDDLTRRGGLEQLSGQKANDWPNSFRMSRLIPAVEYVRAARARTLLMRRFHDYLKQFDALVSPNNSAALTVTNLTGQPQICVPCGLRDGMPLSLLFTGHLFEEGRLVRLAKAYQDTTGWHKEKPAGFAV
jgi:Asp-tRNA(Asn)/Glu-tRNA(Gln) amidotransferase A subunit family amidase